MQQGNPAAISLFYDQYSPLLYGFIRRLISDPVLAEDVLQQTFMVLLKSVVAYDPAQQRLLPWMIRTVAPFVIDAIPVPADIPATTDMNNSVNNAITFILFKGFTLQEAASQLNTPPEVLVHQLKNAFNRQKGGQAV